MGVDWVVVVRIKLVSSAKIGFGLASESHFSTQRTAMPLRAGTVSSFLFVENHQRTAAMTFHNIIRIGFAETV